jgi:hypothetical protein
MGDASYRVRSTPHWLEQRVLNDIALGEFDLQRKVDLATQSQLMREAVDAFAPM